MHLLSGLIQKRSIIIIIPVIKNEIIGYNVYILGDLFLSMKVKLTIGDMGKRVQLDTIWLF